MANGKSLDGIDRAVSDNLRALLEHRLHFERQRSVHERVADGITAATGRMAFVYVLVGIVVGWVVWNLIPGVPHFDPPPYILLAAVTSVAAILLTSIVLVSQSRMTQMAERRETLDLQINLLSEREVTRLLAVCLAMARKLGAEVPADTVDLQRDVDPREILDRIESAEDELCGSTEAEVPLR
jgi:uncharacterized membrane protein